jgi:hypothetical protein
MNFKNKQTPQNDSKIIQKLKNNNLKKMSTSEISTGPATARRQSNKNFLVNA